MTAAIILPHPVLSEEKAWREMAFVDGDKDWAPVAVTGSEHTGYSAAWLLGTSYALEFITHLREYRDMDVWTALPDIVEEMTGTKLGYIEKGFLSTLAEFVAKGSAHVIGDFDAALVP